MKREFRIDHISLSVASEFLRPRLVEALETGRFEKSETVALKKNLNIDDQVLDLGGGIGYTGAVAGQIVSGKNLMIVEANPNLISTIEENLISNLVFGARIINGAVVAEKTGETVPFYKSKSFWAGSVCAGNAPRVQKIQVPAFCFKHALSDFKPTVILCDIEGGEVDLFTIKLPDHVRLIILELHPKFYGQSGIKTIFDHLAHQKFSYHPNGSKGATVCFIR